VIEVAMRNITPLKKIRFSVSVTLLLIILAGCAPFGNKIPAPKATNLSPTEQLTHQNSITPTLLTEWKMGKVFDMAWSPDSRMFVVNSQLMENESNNVQAFDVKSLNRIWIAENSLSINLAFSPNGQLIAESNPFVGVIYLRSAEQGNVVRQIKADNCSGGQFILINPGGNTLLIANTNELGGLNLTHIVYFSLWDLDTGQCKDLLQYSGTFHLFDVNSSGNLITYGGEGKDDHAVIWDEIKQAEVCRTQADFARFVPGQNTLAVFRDQKIVFIDASSCRELRELNIAPILATNFAFSPDGQWLAIAEHSIRIVETATGRTITQIHLPENAVPSFNNRGGLGGLVFSPDGQYLLLAFSTYANDYFDTVQLWQLLR
jgi:WD40 repeat protein